MAHPLIVEAIGMGVQFQLRGVYFREEVRDAMREAGRRLEKELGVKVVIEDYDSDDEDGGLYVVKVRGRTYEIRDVLKARRFKFVVGLETKYWTKDFKWGPTGRYASADEALLAAVEEAVSLIRELSGTD